MSFRTSQNSSTLTNRGAGLSKATPQAASSLSSEITRTELNIVRTDNALVKMERVALQKYVRLMYSYTPELDIELQADCEAIRIVREKLDYMRRQLAGHYAKRNQVQKARKDALG